MQAIEVDAGELFRLIGLDSVADEEPPTAEVLGAHIGEGSAWVAELDGEVVGYAASSVVDGGAMGSRDRAPCRNAPSCVVLGRPAVSSQP